MKYIIKDEYKKVRLDLLSPNKVLLTKLTDKTLLSAFNISVAYKMNEVNTLTFDIPFDNPKINDASCENLVKLGFEHYIIKEINTNSADTRMRSVSCVHEAYELKGILSDPITSIGVTALTMFNAIKSASDVALTNYYWKGTDIPDTTKRSLLSEEEVSVFENLISMAQLFEGWIEFTTDSNGQIGVYLRKNAIDNGKRVIKGRDLKQLNITYNSNEIFTRITPLGKSTSNGDLNIMSVNPTGKSYVEDYSYYLAKGMTLEQIKTTPKCQQGKIYRETDITDANELLRVAKEELAKNCVPKLEGSIEMADLSVFEGSVLTPLVIGEKIIITDRDINYNLSAIVMGFTRNYGSPVNTPIEISNVIKYDNIYKDLVHNSDTIYKITDKDSNGKPILVGSHIQGEIDATKTSFHSMLDSIDKPEAKTAILFEDRRVGSPTFSAMALGTKGFLIADTLDSNGQWIWKTFGTGKGFYADMIVAGIMKADLIKTGILSSFDNSSWLNFDNGNFNLANKLIHDGTSTKFKGIIETYSDSGSKAIEIDRTRLNFYDWSSGARTIPVGGLYSMVYDSNPNNVGLSLCNYINALMTLAYYNQDTGLYSPYIIFDEQNILGNNCAITFKRHFTMKEYQILMGMDNQNRIFSNNKTTVLQVPNVAGAGFKVQTPTSAQMSFEVGSDYPWKIVGNVYCYNDWYVAGAKHAIQDTESYGKKAVDCYETAEPYLGDIGSGKIIDGECYVSIDDILTELTNVNIDYHVFTQVYNGKITSISKQKTYFIVKGEENTEFSWEIKVKRKGYEYNRFHVSDSNEPMTVDMTFDIKENNEELDKNNNELEDMISQDLTSILLSIGKEEEIK